jgi:stress response protein YsnF
MVEGTNAEIAKAEAILNHRGIEELGVYDVPGTQSATVAPSVDLTDLAPSVVTAPVVNDLDVDRPISSADAQTLKSYEERLILDKDREKTGEVEVENNDISTPIEKQPLVIVTIPPNSETVVNSNVDTFHNSETPGVEVYENTPPIYVREEVSRPKQVIQETLNPQETLRWEELDTDDQGLPIIDNRSNLPENPLR